MNQNDHFGLASTHKVLLLAAYAKRVEDGSLRPKQLVPLDHVDRWYWAATDGGAHESALRDWRERGVVHSSNAGVAVSLDEIVWATIRWSDNAATDYLLRRLGGPTSVMATVRFLGVDSQDPPLSIFGVFVAWATVTPEHWLSLSQKEKLQLAQNLAEATTSAEAASLSVPSFETQWRLAGATWRGTPGEWAALMSELFLEVRSGSVMGQVVQRHLEWPMMFEHNQRSLEAFGTKGGTLEGLITEASYIQPTSKDPLVVVLFFRRLPRAVWNTLLRRFTYQRLMVDLAMKSGLLVRACSVL